MQRLSVFLVIGVLMLSLSLPTAYGLQQVAGKLIADINPGESQILEWGLISDNPSKIITLELVAQGEGSEFLSFPEKIDLQPKQIKFVEIIVTIPADYNQRNTLSPSIVAIEKGEAGGPTVINIQMKKVLTINISSEPPEIKEAMTKEITKEEVTAQSETTLETTSLVCGKGTVEEDGTCVIDETIVDPEPVISQVVVTSDDNGGGCLIATATYGSELAPQVQQLRELRDNSLLNTELGTSFMKSFNDFYYSFSPVIAVYERENHVFKEMVKIVITPMISSLSILNYVDMDSEESVLGYGFSLILLNIGMYVGIPASVIVGIRKIRF